MGLKPSQILLECNSPFLFISAYWETLIHLSGDFSSVCVKQCALFNYEDALMQFYISKFVYPLVKISASSHSFISQILF